MVLSRYSVSSTTKTGRHGIAESGVKHNKSNQIKFIVLEIKDDHQSKKIGKPNLFFNLKVFGKNQTKIT